MNNLAFAHGMQPVFCQSYYVGTFGEYDIRTIRRWSEVRLAVLQPDRGYA
jgi:hypothetical protein